jgi:hypothetical protein
MDGLSQLIGNMRIGGACSALMYPHMLTVPYYAKIQTPLSSLSQPRMPR